MNSTRNKFFSRASLPGDHDAGVRLSQRADKVEHLKHFRTLAQNVLELVFLLDSLAKVSHLFYQTSLLDQLFAHEANSLRLKRLRNVITSPQFHCLNRLLDVPES